MNNLNLLRFAATLQMLEIRILTRSKGCNPISPWNRTREPAFRAGVFLLAVTAIAGAVATAQLPPSIKRPVVLPRAAAAPSTKPTAQNPQARVGSPYPLPANSNSRSPDTAQNGTGPCNGSAPGLPGVPLRGQTGYTAGRPCNDPNLANRQQFNNYHGGVGNFAGCCGFSMTLYTCFRNGGQVLCDFDLTNQNNAQADAHTVFGDVRILNSSGRIFPHQDAFFVDADGTQFDTSQITPGNKVRLIMVFENVPETYTTVSLAHAQMVVQAVTISAQDSGAAAQTASARSDNRK
jgi:hypothetical protein